MKREKFYPLTHLRDVLDLRCGARTLADHPERKVNYLWDLIGNLGEDLAKDLQVLGVRCEGEIHSSAVLLNKENMLIEKGVEVEPCAVLDARHGPIYIAKGTVVKAGANLRGPVSIGPNCRINGEVVASIFHGSSNKGHYGFIGHSYIGEWVNLGAGTTNSNLKNTYGSVKVQVNGSEIDSGEQFLGCFVGDYAKTGIGTLITTGAVIGVGANVFGGGVTPKYVPNFAWGLNDKYKFEAFVATAKKMMGRRKRELSAEQEKGLRQLYKVAS
ncbi:MAG: hypothetical protein ABIH69_07000 [bacterium]